MTIKSETMPLYSFTLQPGICVNMIAIYITQTNIGLCGPVSHNTNRWEMEIARNEAMKLWIDVPIHIILPSSEEVEEKNQLLPKWRFMGLLEGQQNTESGVAFSFLVVIYFQNAPYPFVSPDIDLKLHMLNWDQLADHRGTEY